MFTPRNVFKKTKHQGSDIRSEISFTSRLAASVLLCPGLLFQTALLYMEQTETAEKSRIKRMEFPDVGG